MLLLKVGCALLNFNNYVILEWKSIILKQKVAFISKPIKVKFCTSRTIVRDNLKSRIC